MRFLLASFFVMAFIAGVGAQNRPFSQNIKPRWEGGLKVPGGNSKSTELFTCPGCTGSATNFRVPVFQLSFPGKSLSQIQLINTVFSPLMPWESSGVDTSAIKYYIPFETALTEVRRESTTLLNIQLIRKNDAGNWEKLISADITGNISKLIIPSSSQRIAAATSSVFSQGDWLKLGVTKTGVYSISGAELQAAGLNLIASNPATIKMYGTGNKMLPEANNAFNFQDVPEIAIDISGSGDGVFDPTDRIFFYGEDPHRWLYNQTNKSFEFQTNIYSDTSFYFLTSTPGNGLRIAQAPPQSTGSVNVNFYEERDVAWEDKVNVISAGREWYGSVLDFTTSKSFNFSGQNLFWDSLQSVRVGLMARSFVKYPFSVAVNNVSMSTKIIPEVTQPEQYASYGRPAIGFYKQVFSKSGDGSNFQVNIQYEKQGNQSSLGYINYVEFNSKRWLNWSNSGFGFRNYSLRGTTVNYSINNVPTDFAVWEVTKPLSPVLRPHQNGNFSALLDTLREFYGFNTGTSLKPVSIKRMSNQNLRGIPCPDLLIVSHPAFWNEANKLADFRRSHDQLDVAVVNLFDIYNEFSSGSQDITAIRNFAMHLYYLGETPKLKYLLLFGDCSYDYKSRIANNTNFVPTYESPESLNIVSSYASDDYFGILNRMKGGWSTSDLIDIGVGRLPAKTPQEAMGMVDKLIHYASQQSTLGKWRNTFTFVADDGDYCTHSDQSDRHATKVNTAYPPSVLKKIYLGMYEQIANAGGFTSPGATNDLLNTIANGSLTINYTGHGGETGWADENIFNSDLINGLTNKDRLSFFITATCDFGRHDLPAQVSGAESLVLNPNGGAIGILTTGRPVISSNNDEINRSLYANLFGVDSEGKHIRMGELLRRTKNGDGSKANNRGFTLLGDPSAALAFPEQDVVITDFAGDTVIQGLELFAFQGEVRKDDQLNSSFNGTLFSTVFDRPGFILVNDNEPGVYHCPPIGEYQKYDYQNSVLYNGSVPVVDGKFNVQFFVPKDISYQVGKGKISLYAKAESLEDAAGAKLNLSVGGINPNPIIDDFGPEISLLMNDNSFVNGGLVGSNANLIAYLEDSSGINVSGLGLGHDLMATLDGQQVYILNNYFQNNIGSYKKGFLEFPFRDLTAGTHTLTLKAWDNFNNSNTSSIDFVVGVSAVNNLIVKDVRLFPNPFSEEVFLSLENAYAGKTVLISLEVTDMLGKQVASNGWIYNNSKARPGAFKELAWDGKKEDGTRLPAGSYFCTIRLKSDTDGAEYKINKKLILVR